MHFISHRMRNFSLIAVSLLIMACARHEVQVANFGRGESISLEDFRKQFYEKQGETVPEHLNPASE